MDLTFGNMLSGEKLLPFYFVLCRASNVGTFMYLYWYTENYKMLNFRVNV